MGPRADLDATARRENVSPCLETNPARAASSLVLTLTELPQFFTLFM